MISCIYLFLRVLGVGEWNGEVIFRELEKVLGCTHASSKVNTPVRYADGLDESCRTRWLLVKYAQRTGDPKLLVSLVLLNSDAIIAFCILPW